MIVTSLVFVHCDVAELVATAVRNATLDAGVEEHKSSNRMDSAPQLRQLRAHLFEVMFRHGCRIATVVSPRSERHLIADHAGRLVDEIVAAFEIDDDLQIYFDEGIDPPTLWSPGVRTCSHFGQDSRAVPGIQLADLAAHSTATMLLGELGILKKKVKAGENSGYDPDDILNIEFQLWAFMRYCFASNERYHAELDWTESNYADYKPFGLYVSPSCSEDIEVAVRRQLGTVWLGCIH